MDKTLLFTVLFVTLSCMFMNTYAQSSTTASMTTTVAPTMTATTGTMTTTTTTGGNMTTTTGGNMTTTTTGGNMTTTTTGGNMTTTTTGGNMTTTGGNMTTTGGNMTTTAVNMTTTAVNMTTAAVNMTTTTTAVTTAPPLSPNTTVEPLQTPVSRAECGTQQLCVAEPSVCDPSATGSCFFLAARQQSGSNFDFSISGESDGYIAATLSPDNTVGNNDTTYVCANNNGVVRFFSTVLNNGQLVSTELSVNSVRGRVDGRRIQCSFAATLPSATTRTTGFAISLSDGPFNSTSGDLGSPTARFRSPVVDLTNVNATVNNEITTTAAPTTTVNHGITFHQSLTQALLITVGALGLAML
ncbi:putative ferric-chelate reductase 1 isoform X2 [Seriola aureovittata]|uniref:putative ferric-chelate reductase 1 isoform X2 n=1 Tax=Seriola aureovittata TaxID=2871759 RepID=UPI0024BDC4D0|nr:putative ferric-chelate reductase 1 isoform X2 [Seriola aureovittata]